MVKNLETELKEKDEYLTFKQTVVTLKEKNNEILLAMFNSLSDKKKVFFNDVLQCQRIDVNKEHTQARRIVKLKAKKVANVQYENGDFVQK